MEIIQPDAEMNKNVLLFAVQKKLKKNQDIRGVKNHLDNGNIILISTKIYFTGRYIPNKYVISIDQYLLQQANALSFVYNR